MSNISKGLRELETEVKIQYNKDKSSPEMYSCLKNLCEKMLVVRRFTYNGTEADEISHEMATDLYFKLNNSDKPFTISSWNKYISLICTRYVKSYLSERNKVVFTLPDMIDQDRMSRLLYNSSNYRSDIDEVVKPDEYVKDIPDLISDTYHKCVRYQEGTSMYNKLWISIIKSMLSNRIILYELDDYYYGYVKFLLDIIMRQIGNFISLSCTNKSSYVLKSNEILNSLESFDV